MNRWGCFVNPAWKNEDYNMELSGTGERSGNSWASGCPEATDPEYSFLI
jgi:hypothetical protein